jgi:3-(3-hydroxy-phenyl)propionate hydroxylase
MQYRDADKMGASGTPMTSDSDTVQDSKDGAPVRGEHKQIEKLDRIVIIGAGPVGLAAALRLASLDIPTTLLEAKSALEKRGSKALCIQHGVLKIFDLLGCAQNLVDEGVPWSISRTFVRDIELFRAHFKTPPHDPLPPFLNISQFRTEQILLDGVRRTGRVTELWHHSLVGLRQDDDQVVLEVNTPSGIRYFSCEYVIGCDGINSAVRTALNVDWLGYSHADRFLIADVRTAVNFPRERRFYFDAASNPGRQIVVHAQPNGMWRFDWQLPPDARVDDEERSGRLAERIRALIGDIPYEVDWLSTYRFHQRSASRLCVGRVFLAGDAAHAMPPFGARGMNSGIQDVDNLAWKLALVAREQAPGELLESYHVERQAAAHENLAVTETTIRFMVPPTRWHRLLRNLVLACSRRYPALHRLVNSGEMSVPNRYRTSPILPPGRRSVLSRSRNTTPGQVIIDAPCRVNGRSTRLRHLACNRFLGLYFCTDAAAATAFARLAAATPVSVPFHLHIVPPVGLRLEDLPPEVAAIDDFTGTLNGLYSDNRPCFYLLRPDGYIAARQTDVTGAQIAGLIEHATGAMSANGDRTSRKRGNRPKVVNWYVRRARPWNFMR